MTKHGGKEPLANSHKRVNVIQLEYVPPPLTPESPPPLTPESPPPPLTPLSPPPLSPLSNTPLTDAEILYAFGLFASPTNNTNPENLDKNTSPIQRPPHKRSKNITRRILRIKKIKISKRHKGKTQKKHKRKTRTRK
jgi:hypothetical protein